jgi:hypothetical protein
VLGAAGSGRTTPRARPVWGADRQSVTAEPIRLETPWDRRDAVLGALRRFLDGESPPACVRLERVAAKEYGKPPLLLAPIDATGDGPPRWAIGSFDMAEVWGVERFAMEPEGLEYETRDGSRLAHVVDLWGRARAWTEQGEERPAEPAPGTRPVGRDCLVRHDGQWWVVDPVAGAVQLQEDTAVTLPPGVIGGTRLGDRTLLATADQRLLVLDAKTIVRSFPATVVPARRFRFGECAMLAAGDGWIASLDQSRGVLFMYDADGTPLGRLPLARSVGTQPHSLHGIRGAGDYLGVGHDLTVSTFRVVRDASCLRPGRAGTEAAARHSS